MKLKLLGIVLIASHLVYADSLRQVRAVISLTDVITPSEKMFVCDQANAIEIREEKFVYLLMPGLGRSREWHYIGQIKDKKVQLSEYDDFPYSKPELDGITNGAKNCQNSNHQTLQAIGISVGARTAVSKPSPSVADPVAIQIGEAATSSITQVKGSRLRFSRLLEIIALRTRVGDRDGARKTAIVASENVPVDVQNNELQRFTNLARDLRVQVTAKKVPTSPPTPPTIPEGMEKTSEELKQKMMILKRQHPGMNDQDIATTVMADFYRSQGQTPDATAGKVAQDKAHHGDFVGARAALEGTPPGRARDLNFQSLAQLESRESGAFQESFNCAMKIGNAEARANTLIDILSVMAKKYVSHP